MYVDQSKASLDRGGSATLDAFMGLAPRSLVTVKAAIFPSPTKNTKSTRGPCIRCIAIGNNNTMGRRRVSSSSITSFDVGNVDSVDKVHRILTKYMQVPVSFVDVIIVYCFSILFCACEFDAS